MNGEGFQKQESARDGARCPGWRNRNHQVAREAGCLGNRDGSALREQLKSSIKQLGIVAKKIKLVLGEHREADFKTNDIIVVNPAVPRESKYLAIAKKHGARLENEASLFFRYSRNPIIAVTGTRGRRRP